jgi:hypothetical protein
MNLILCANIFMKKYLYILEDYMEKYLEVNMCNKPFGLC